MVTIQGINAASGFVLPPADKPKEAPEQPPAQPTDSVEVSLAGSSAAASQKALQGDLASEIRQEQVEAAKARLAEGTNKLQSTVLQVAARVVAFIE